MPARPLNPHDLAVVAPSERFAHLIDQVLRAVDVQYKVCIPGNAQRHCADHVTVGKQPVRVKEDDVLQQHGVHLPVRCGQQDQAIQRLRHGHQTQPRYLAAIRLKMKGQIDAFCRKQRKGMARVDHAGRQHRHHLPVKVIGQPGSLLLIEALPIQDAYAAAGKFRQQLLPVQRVLLLYLPGTGAPDRFKLLKGFHARGVGGRVAGIRFALQLADADHKKLIKV